MARISIIIVSYNNFSVTTGPCIESILARTGRDDYEIVVVDNASPDGAADKLRARVEREPRIRAVLNQTNRGFAGGNNDGVKVATGDYLVLLNSDTQVTEGWLTRMLEVLDSDETIGLVGPVSNSTGNEQQIFVQGTSPEEIIRGGREWVRSSRGDQFALQRLTFFCVALRRSLFDELEGLDESFGLGFYEDDDFCSRARKAGYRLVCCEDVFVYHRGNESFKKTPKAVTALMKRNKRLLEHKLGTRYRYRHPRDRQLDLVEAYCAQALCGGDAGTLAYKCTNRLAMAKKMMPKGFIKRMLYRVRLARIARRCPVCSLPNQS